MAQWDQPPEQPSEAGQMPRVNRTAWIVAAAVVAVVLTASVIAYLGGRGPDGGDGAREGDWAVAGAREGREEATFVLLDGATSVTVRSVDLGDELYRVATPEGGDHRPETTVVDDEVRLELIDSGQDGPSRVEISLHAQVRWQVRLQGGATEQILDLADGDITGVELAGGAERIELTLPPPRGTTTVRMSQGASEWIVRRVGDAPVRVRVGAGAGTVTIDGERTTGVAGGTEFTPPGWEQATDRVDIDAVAGVALLEVEQVPADS